MRTHLALRGWRRVSRATLALAFLAAFVALAAVFALPASASPRGVNGQLAYGLFNPLLGDTQVYVINPDGVGGGRLVQGATETGEEPRWFPDGIHVATGGAFDLPGGGSRIINVDDGTARDVGGQDPNLFTPVESRRPTGSCFCARRSATTGARTASTPSGRLTAVASRRSPPTRVATTSPAIGRRTGSGSCSSALARAGIPRACSLSTPTAPG